MDPNKEKINLIIQQSRPGTKTQLLNSFVFIIVILILIIGLLFGIYFMEFRNNQTRTLRRGRLSVTPIPTRPNVNKQQIAKVGSEIIYAEDLAIEMAAYPLPSDPNTKKVLLEKLVKDSVILQGAAADNFITLNENIFNSPYKNYNERIKLVNEAKAKIDKQDVEISGTIISIWIFNTAASDIGYEKSKEIVSVKATKLYNDVKNNKITLEQAGDEIKKDSSLKGIDGSYQENAYIPFSASNEDQITFDPAFDSILRKLKIGELSPLYIGKDYEQKSRKILDTVYMFGKLNKKNTKPTSDFDDWYKKKDGSYEKKYY